MSDIKKLLAIKRQMRNKRPRFSRDGYRKRIRITNEWRKPRGRHNKMKDKKAGHRRMPMPGFRTNRLVRGLHISGLIPKMVYTLADVAKIDKKTQGAVIAKTVGNRKRVLLIEALQKAGVSMLNIKDGHAQKIQEALKLRKKLREEAILEKSQKKSKFEKKEQKKEIKHEKELTAEEKAEQEKKEKDKILTKAEK